jgi:hypothetical protein
MQAQLAALQQLQGGMHTHVRGCWLRDPAARGQPLHCAVLMRVSEAGGALPVHAHVLEGWVGVGWHGSFGDQGPDAPCNVGAQGVGQQAYSAQMYV